MKKSTFILITSSVLIIVLIFFFTNKKEDHTSVLANVNGKAIKLEEFKARFSEVISNSKDLDAETLLEMKETLLRRMIVENLIIDEAKLRDINVSKDELTRYANNIKNNISTEAFQQLLVEQFKTEYTWSEDLKRKLLIEKCLSQIIIEKIKLSEAEIEQYYTNYYLDKISPPNVRLAQIFTYKKDTAEEALNELKNGELFTDVAIKYSEAPEGKKGGYLGEISKNTNIDIFDIAFSMKENELSDIIQSDYGYHIIKLVKIIPPKKTSLLEAKSFIFNEMINQKEKLFYEKWLENKFTNSKILINQALLNSIE